MKISQRIRKTAKGQTTYITLSHDGMDYQYLVRELLARYPEIQITSGGIGSVTGKIVQLAPKPVYPTELIEKAEYELKVFERCSQETCEELINEVKALRAKIDRISTLVSLLDVRGEQYYDLEKELQ